MTELKNPKLYLVECLMAMIHEEQYDAFKTNTLWDALITVKSILEEDDAR
jgi:hypothetical protein